jgi:hypothetical protein
MKPEIAVSITSRDNNMFTVSIRNTLSLERYDVTMNIPDTMEYLKELNTHPIREKKHWGDIVTSGITAKKVSVHLGNLLDNNLTDGVIQLVTMEELINSFKELEEEYNNG